MAENRLFGTPFLIQKSPRNSSCGSLFVVLSQELRHIDFGGPTWGILGGGHKVSVEQVYLLFLSLPVCARTLCVHVSTPEISIVWSYQWFQAAATLSWSQLSECAQQSRSLGRLAKCLPSPMALTHDSLSTDISWLSANDGRRWATDWHGGSLAL